MKEKRSYLQYAANLSDKTDPPKFSPAYGELRPEKSLQKNKPGVSPTHASKNYFTLHWEGEYSLTKSYWINYVVVGILFYFLLSIYPEELITSTIHDLYIYITLYCIAFTVITWQILGVWRSANNHIQKTKRKFWANTVKALMIFGLISSSCMAQNLLPGIHKFICIFAQDADTTTYSIRVLDNRKEIEVSGGIKFGLTRALRNTIKKFPTIRVIHLNSYGGRVLEARFLRKFIEEKDLITSTTKGCYSACTIAFMGGSSRFIYGKKKLGFHRYGIVNSRTDSIRKTIFESFAEDKLFFVKKGASYTFMNRIYNTSPSDLWFPENDVLFSNHIITDIGADKDFLLYRETVPDLHDEIEKILSDILVYPVIKEDNPKISHKNI